MTTTPDTSPRKRRRRKSAPQARGLARREKILTAVTELFASTPYDDISYGDLAAHADVPIGSLYHFFPSKLSICAALAQEFGNLYVLEMNKPFAGVSISSWKDIVDQQIDRGAALVENNPAARRIIFGGKTPPEIKMADRANDRRLAHVIESAFSTYFHLPKIPNKQEVFYLYVEIVDLIFTLSVIEHGHVTAHAIGEAQRAGKAYLSCYIPDVLKRRGAPDTVHGLLLAAAE